MQLRSDPDVDFEAFKQRRNASVHDENFIYEPLDNERDEGLQWPSRFAALPKAIVKDCTVERICVMRDTMVYMQAALKDNWTNEDKNSLLHCQSSYKPVCCNSCPIHVEFPSTSQLMTLVESSS